MKTNHQRRSFLIMTGLALLTGAGVRADDDHERARRALREGRVRPLAEILARIGDALGGEVIEVELDYDDGLYLYELKVLSPNGRLQEVTVDAATARILEWEAD